MFLALVLGRPALRSFMHANREIFADRMGKKLSALGTDSA